jgi:hypothetical protein
VELRPKAVGLENMKGETLSKTRLFQEEMYQRKRKGEGGQKIWLILQTTAKF